MEIWDSATKRDHDEADILHAVRNIIGSVPVEGRGPHPFRMWIGPNRKGDLLEIGIVYPVNGEPAVVHVMDLRDSYYVYVPGLR